MSRRRQSNGTPGLPRERGDATLYHRPPARGSLEAAEACMCPGGPARTQVCALLRWLFRERLSTAELSKRKASLRAFPSLVPLAFGLSARSPFMPCSLRCMRTTKSIYERFLLLRDAPYRVVRRMRRMQQEEEEEASGERQSEVSHPVLVRESGAGRPGVTDVDAAAVELSETATLRRG
ncbi:hypothetical protein HPB50_015218 [Hyalomma asiaticum]|uniref:Uncharacterized protein n=1 Tax=Hyalomma asiaticum TaxID=266040 RepID=A0ACB7SR74_HYAAI|nr:hypothetical protein HPB50_015218 [Hyalomma asiaticum]